MNERIQKLAIQVMHSDTAPHLTTELYSFTKSEFEKFAELIILKCADISDKAEPYKSNDLILKYFGLKE